MQNFYNQGFGWICRRCEAELTVEKSEASHSRIFLEGETESKSLKLSNTALAKWADAERTTLVCPRCGTSEPA